MTLREIGTEFDQKYPGGMIITEFDQKYPGGMIIRYRVVAHVAVQATPNPNGPVVWGEQVKAVKLVRDMPLPSENLRSHHTGC